MSIAFVNNFKTVLLLGALMGLVVGVGITLGGVNAILPALVIAIIMNVGAFFLSDKLAIAAMRGQEVTGGKLYDMVDELRQRAGLPMPRVYVCPQQAPNAFATGRSPRKAAVAVTEGALQLLTREELEGVMAHELAHVKNRDTLMSTIAATVGGLMGMLAYGLFLFGGSNREGANPLVAIVAVMAGAVGAAVIKAMLSRSREFVADADGAKIAGSPDGLISALRKLEMYAKRIPMQNPNPAQNNLFIIEPLTGGKTLSDMFATHPPTDKRVEALMTLR
ncbi:MAG: M48 family metalloprotease [Phycisphaerales bacterium]|jgi:heat shock protein HtpX